MNLLSHLCLKMRTVDYPFLTLEQKQSHLLKLVSNLMSKLNKRRLSSSMLQSRRNWIIRQLLLHKLNQQTLQLMARIFQNLLLLMQLQLRETWMLKMQRRNQRPHSKQISNLLLIKDIQRNKLRNLPSKKLSQINKLISKLKLKLRYKIQFHQKKVSLQLQLQQNQLPRKYQLLSQKLRLQLKNHHPLKNLLLLQLKLLVDLQILFQFKIKSNRLRNNRNK